MINKKNNSWYKKQIIARNDDLGELVDFEDDDTAEEASELMSPDIVNLDEIERQTAQNMSLEQGEPTTITEEEISGLLVDDLVEQDEEAQIEEGYFDGSYVPSEDELKEIGIESIQETGDEVDEDPEGVPDFGENHEAAIRWAIENNRVVKLSYLTLGKKRGRGGSRSYRGSIAAGYARSSADRLERCSPATRR